MASEEVLDVDVARRKMKQWRDENYRNSDEVVDLGEALLSEHSSKLGDEIWTVYEQVFIAALDCGRYDLATGCLRALHQQFPNSSRVRRLRGMRLEALEDYDDAVKHYKIILKDDPGNLIARKRLIAIKRAQNDTVGAILELNQYLKDFMGDQEAWMELSELYVSQQEFSKAAFCVEELILSHPHNHLYHQRYAEIQYTIGTAEAMDLARRYFAQALKLDPNSIRAMYGLCLASSNHLSSNKGTAKTKRNVTRYMGWAVQQLSEKYDVSVGNSQSSQLKIVEQMLDSMQLSLPSNAEL